LRSFLSSVPKLYLREIQKATVRKHTWKGIHFCKDPFDIALYQLLLWELQPKTIIEVGTKAGGSALWLRDQSRVLELDAPVISIDTDPSKLDSRARKALGIYFITADARDLASYSEVNNRVIHAPHPWLVIEDSDHNYETVKGSLAYFGPKLVKGDYLVVEDGVMETFGNSHQYDGGPNRAVEEFLKDNQNYEVDYRYTDYYGTNVTWAPNGWLRRVK